MKKRYLIMSSFFLVGTVLTVMAFLFQHNDERRNEELETQNAQAVDTVKELRINASTKYVVEIYDGTTDVTISEERTVPAEIAGMSREDLEQYIRDYNETMDVQRREEEPNEMELVSFSKEKVVMREIYLGAEEETGFYLKATQGEVVIYHNDRVTPYENTGILVELLPEEERKKLEEGYYVEDEKELYSILENFSS